MPLRNKEGPDGLYLEVRADKLPYYQSLGFQAIGLPFKASAWTGDWVPTMLDLRSLSAPLVAGVPR